MSLTSVAFRLFGSNPLTRTFTDAGKSDVDLTRVIYREVFCLLFVVAVFVVVIVIDDVIPPPVDILANIISYLFVFSF